MVPGTVSEKLYPHRLELVLPRKWMIKELNKIWAFFIIKLKLQRIPFTLANFENCEKKVCNSKYTGMRGLAICLYNKVNTCYTATYQPASAKHQWTRMSTTTLQIFLCTQIIEQYMACPCSYGNNVLTKAHWTDTCETKQKITEDNVTYFFVLLVCCLHKQAMLKCDG